MYLSSTKFLNQGLKLKIYTLEGRPHREKAKQNLLSQYIENLHQKPNKTIQNQNMSKLFPLLLLIISFSGLYAQNTSADIPNLLSKIETALQNDSLMNTTSILEDCQKVENLLDGKINQSAADYYCLKCKALSKDRQKQAAVEACLESIDISKKLDQPDYETLIKAYNRMAQENRRLKKYDLVIDQTLAGIQEVAPHLDSNHTEIGQAWLMVSRAERRKGNYKAAIKYGKKTQAIFESNPQVKPKAFVDLYNNLGSYYQRSGDNITAIEFYNKALKRQKEYNPRSDEYGDILYNFGNTYLSIGAFNKALESYDQAIRIYEKTGDEDNVLSRCFVGKGIVYRNWGDYDRTLSYYKNALAMAKKDKDIYPPNLATTYMNIGACHRHMKNFPEARKNINKALSIYQDFFKKSHSYIGRGLAHLGEVEKQEKNYELATEYFDQAIENYSTHASPEHRYIAVILASKARIAHETKDYPKALKLSDQALNHSLRNEFNHSYAKRWKAAKAETLIAIGEINQALELLNNTLDEINFDYKNIEATPMDYLSVSSHILIIKGKAYYKIYQNNRDLDDLKKAGFEYSTAVDVLLHLRAKLQSDNSRVFVLEKHFENIANSIKILEEMYQKTNEEKYLENAFHIVEKTKSLVLMETLEKRRMTSLADISPKILERERYLNSNLELFKKLRYKEEQKETPSLSIIETLDQEIFSLETSKTAFQDTLNTYLKPFKESEFIQTNLITLKEKLSDNQSVTLEYFLTDSILYLFTFENNQVHFDKISLPSDFKNNVFTYCENLSNPQIPFNQSNSESISKKILTTAFQHLKNKEIKKITIIPDLWLGYLPFETLSNPRDDQQLLFENYDISYAYAAHLLLTQENMTTGKANKSIATFAPKYQSSNQAIAEVLRTRTGKTLSDLPGAKREADLIAQLFDGDAFTGSEVTEDHFRQNAKNYQLLHLSMHAEMDDINPMYSQFIFNTSKDSIEDGVITAAELYNLPLQADLAVLSACNTGFGAIKKGEGIMSLSRAFQYAGVPATVMSLWKVPDDATSIIMTHFYQHLKDGQTKDHALRLAKQAYLDQTVSPEQRHPFYWAGFVAAGDMKEVTIGSDRSWLWLLGGVFVLAGLLGYRRRIS